MYTLDTNTIIYYLKDDPDAVAALRDIFSQDAPLYISAITEIELFGFPMLSDHEAEQIEALLRTMAVISVDSRIARTAGLIRPPTASISPTASSLPRPFLPARHF